VTSFSDLGLVPPILRALAEAGYERPTPIQVQAIPPALEGRDLLGCAQTGTGKTAAFALPILQLAHGRSGERARLTTLVLTPTRELAAQIGESFATYGKHLDLWHTVVFGGVSQRPQEEELKKGVDVLVATPGRLLDLLSQKVLSLSQIEFFVLDEADRMLDMGFLPDVRRVVAHLPKKRQTLFFSATMPTEIRALAETLLVDPVSVAVAPVSSTAERVEQHVFFVEKGDKPRLLVDLLRRPEVTRTLVFSRTKHGANRIAQQLEKAGVRAAAIHGNKSQGARTRALEGFKDSELSVLVATDLAARGIDIDGVSHVINFDLPNVPETYVHRIGRTGRASASGIALSFCDTEERAYLVDIERLIGRHIDRVDEHAFASPMPPPPPTDLSPRRGGGPRPAQPSGQRGGQRGAPRPAQGARTPPKAGGAGPRVQHPEVVTGQRPTRDAASHGGGRGRRGHHGRRAGQGTGAGGGGGRGGAG
jgi:ATP-dependent RNA helicase RhlE